MFGFLGEETLRGRLECWEITTGCWWDTHLGMEADLAKENLNCNKISTKIRANPQGALKLRWPFRAAVNKEKGTHLACDVYIFLNRFRELGGFGRASFVKALTFPGPCISNMADSDQRSKRTFSGLDGR